VVSTPIVCDKCGEPACAARGHMQHHIDGDTIEHYCISCDNAMDAAASVVIKRKKAVVREIKKKELKRFSDIDLDSFRTKMKEIVSEKACSFGIESVKRRTSRSTTGNDFDYWRLVYGVEYVDNTGHDRISWGFTSIFRITEDELKRLRKEGLHIKQIIIDAEHMVNDKNVEQKELGRVDVDV